MNHAGDPPTRFCKKCGQEDHGSAGCHTGPKGVPQISLPDEGIENLVEEIARMVYRPSTGCSWDWKEGIERARGAIVRTLAAVRDGKVKIPGEARRTWLDEFEGYCEEEYGTHRVIILFPEDLARYNEEAEAKKRRDEKAE